MPEWPKGAACKVAGVAYGGSNPPPPTTPTERPNPTEPTHPTTFGAFTRLVDVPGMAAGRDRAGPDLGRLLVCRGGCYRPLCESAPFSPGTTQQGAGTECLEGADHLGVPVAAPSEGMNPVTKVLLPGRSVVALSIARARRLRSRWQPRRPPACVWTAPAGLLARWPGDGTTAEVAHGRERHPSSSLPRTRRARSTRRSPSMAATTTVTGARRSGLDDRRRLHDRHLGARWTSSAGSR